MFDLKSILWNGRPKPTAPIRVAAALLAAATTSAVDGLKTLGTSAAGLGEDEASHRLRQYGPNSVVSDARHGRHGRLRLLGRALVNPLVVLLAVLAAVSFATGDPRAGAVMLLMIVLGVTLRFAQEARADSAAKLKALIRLTATVVRGGQPLEIPLEELVSGDGLCYGMG